MSRRSVKCLLGLLVIGFSVSTIAQVVSHGFSEFKGDGPKTSITCYGIADLGPKWTPSRTLMASACLNVDIGVKCARRFEPPGQLFFDSMFDIESGPLQGGLDVWEVQKWAQICRIKCNCTTIYDDADDDIFGNMPTVAQSYYEWNFDKSISTKPLGLYESDKHVILTGTNARHLEQSVSSNRDSDWGLDTYDIREYDTRSAGFYGKTENGPSCTVDIFTPYGEDSMEGMDQVLYHSIFMMNPMGGQYHTAESLCLHEYYGGRERANMGGVCLLGIDGRRHLQFPYNYRAPKFTRDFYYNPSLSTLTTILLIKNYCRSQCFCAQEVEEDVRRRAYLAATAELQRIAMRNPPDDVLPTYTLTTGTRIFQFGPLSPRRRRRPGLYKLNTCSAVDSCQSNTECGSEYCKCQVTHTVNPANFDLGTFVASCGLYIVAQSVAQYGAAGDGVGGSFLPGKNLGGRSVEQQAQAQAQAQAPLCACNATYVSQGCCFVHDGLLWEAPELKMGELRKRTAVGDSLIKGPARLRRSK